MVFGTEKMTLKFKVLTQGFQKFRLVNKQLLRTRKASSLFVFGGLFLNLAAWALMVWLARTEQSIVILHYNAFMGIDVVTNIDESLNYFQIFIAPIWGTSIFIMNLAIAYILCLQSEFLEATVEESKKAHKVLPKKNLSQNKLCENDINMLGIHLILGGSLMLQLIVFLYTIAIIWVNR